MCYHTLWTWLLDETSVILLVPVLGRHVSPARWCVRQFVQHLHTMHINSHTAVCQCYWLYQQWSTKRERGGRSWVLHPSRETDSSMAGVQLLRCDVSVSCHHISSMTLWTDAVHATQLATNQSVGKYQGTQRRDATKPLDAHCCHMGTACSFWHSGTLTLRAERQSAQMSEITNDGLTRSGTGCYIAVPIWQQWASKG